MRFNSLGPSGDPVNQIGHFAGKITMIRDPDLRSRFEIQTLTRHHHLQLANIMAFTDFKSADEVQKAYQIRYLEQDFITVIPKALPEYFVQEFQFNRDHFDIFASEASRCEAVIYPMLREACKNFVQEYSLWSHKSIAADPTLTGTPDYIIAKRSQLGKNVLDFPLVLVAEAKQNDFVRGWGQCLAEMVAAQRLNQNENSNKNSNASSNESDNENSAVYGIVTDGEIWQFGQLVGNVFTKNLSRVTIDRLEEVYGAIFELIQRSIVNT